MAIAWNCQLPESVQVCDGYDKSIFIYLLDLESKVNEPWKKMKFPGDEGPRLRSELVNWMVEVHSELNLNTETLHLSVSIVDRFSQAENVNVEVEDVELLGGAALLIAAKYNESKTKIADLIIRRMRGSYEKDQLYEMEWRVLKTLDYFVDRPSPCRFLDALTGNTKYHVYSRYLANYLVELGFLDATIARCPSSLLAASAFYLARDILFGKPLDLDVDEHFEYDSEVLTLVIDELRELAVMSTKSPFQSSRTKYATDDLFEVSMLPEFNSTSR